MAGNGPAEAPDLQAILATLSQFTTPTTFNPAPPPTENSAAYIPDAAAFAGENAIAASHNTAMSERVADPRRRPQSRTATASPKPMIDPATITVWQDGLRCVTKIAAQNSQFAATIRRMLQDQKQNELRWYSERQALKQAQANRGAASAKAQSILQSLGSGVPSVPASTQTEQEKQKEVAAFDSKIYSAQVAMEEAMIGELKGLGVPFFGTKQDLVVTDDDAKSIGKSLDGAAKWSPVVSKSELMELRRKMVGHLEDLYRD